MKTTGEQAAAMELRWDLAALRRDWPWFVVLGVVLILVGVFALASQVIASLLTAAMIGGLLLVAGAIESVGAFWSRRWSGFFLHLLSGLLSLVVGVLFVWAPLDAALALTLLMACLLLVGGTFRIVAAPTLRFENWTWSLTNGIIDLILGAMIWLAWPASGLWVIGMFLGISLVFRGFNWIALGATLRAQFRAHDAATHRVSGAVLSPSIISGPTHAGW